MLAGRSSSINQSIAFLSLGNLRGRLTNRRQTSAYTMQLAAVDYNVAQKKDARVVHVRPPARQ